MTTLKIWTVVFAALLLMATVVSGTVVAQDSKSQDPKAQDAKVVEGTLKDIDQNARMLTLKAGDNEMQFSFTDQTELVAPDNNGKPPLVTQGTKMRVHYTERENTKVATKIEIIEVTAAR
jgi:Cu/Ag efflux protein CusF